MRVYIVRREDIEIRERESMYALFSEYYENACRSHFESDLDKKDMVIILRNDDMRIVGFSTIEVYMHKGSRITAAVVFSGDTIIDRRYRIGSYLPGAFASVLIETMNRYNPLPVFWLLASKGVGTYRCLPIFFREFLPSYKGTVKIERKQLADGIAFEKFGSAYSPETQVVYHNKTRDRLRPGRSDLLLAARDDPHIRYFISKNPGYADGDELVCLAEVSETNMNRKAYWAAKRAAVEWL